MGKVTETKIKPVKAKIWTSAWNTNGFGCWHVQWGSGDGPELSFSVVKQLTEKYFKENKSEHDLRDLRFIAATHYASGMYEFPYVFYKDP